jgi:hypothetical protein
LGFFRACKWSVFVVLDRSRYSAGGVVGEVITL